MLKYDAGKAKARAAELNLDTMAWARLARVSKPTLVTFLRDSSKLKHTTIEAICAALGMRAFDIMIPPPDLVVLPRHTVRASR